MAWWGWGILGMALLCTELLAVDAQFYLVLAGVAAILVGLLGFVGIDMPVYLQWLLFAVLAIATMFTVRGKIYAKLMSNPKLGKISTDLDQRVVVTQELPPGKSCRLEYRGIAREVCLAREDIHHLRTRDARHEFHCHRRKPGLAQRLDLAFAAIGVHGPDHQRAALGADHRQPEIDHLAKRFRPWAGRDYDLASLNLAARGRQHARSRAVGDAIDLGAFQERHPERTRLRFERLHRRIRLTMRIVWIEVAADLWPDDGGFLVADFVGGPALRAHTGLAD